MSLWDELHPLFDTDDGSLPEVEILYADPRAVAKAFALIRQRSTSQAGAGPSELWSVVDGQSRDVDSVPNAAELVVSGQAQPFHAVFRFGGIPDLGVFVCSDTVALDYRKGEGWTPESIDAFFRLLLELSALDPGASLRSTLDAALFQPAWRRYREQSSR